MTRLLSWPIRKTSSRDLLSLALLVLLLGCVALGLADAIREVDPSLMWFAALLGLLAGWLLAMTSLRGWIALVIAPLLGIVLVFLRVGQLDAKLLALIQALGGPIEEFFRWLLTVSSVSELFQGTVLNWETVSLILEELQADGSTLIARERAWIAAVLAGEPTFDPAAAALMWSLAMWIVSAWAGWMARRRTQPLLSLTPAGVLLLAALYYRSESPSLLLAILGAGLLLMALLTHDGRIRRWQAAGIGTLENGRRVARIVVNLTLVLLIAAALVPSLSVRQIVELFERHDKNMVDALAESLGVEREEKVVPEEIAIFKEVRTAGLAREHLIGSGPELDDRRVMIIKTDDDLPILTQEEAMVLGEQDQLPPVPRYYWRSLTYDLYVYFGWYTGDTEIVKYGAGEQAITPTLGLTSTQRLLQQDVRIIGDVDNMVFVAGLLVSVDHDYNVAWRTSEDAFGATTLTKTYHAESLLPVFTVEQLQAAGTDYPDWVRSRYLWLPNTVPERVIALARDLTATEPTPYDRAYAIETYLRTFPYNLDVPKPTGDRDVADYFLFDLQEGYCDYYATAMVVMARAAGLPARYVTGYTTGTYDYTEGTYLVVEANAHSWAEVYFPGYGWVEFEPTAGLPEIERPSEGRIKPFEPPPIPKPDEETAAITQRWWDVTQWPWWLTSIAGLALLILAIVAWIRIDTWRLRRLRPAAAVTTLYRRLRRQAARLAVPVRVSDTPNEFAAALACWAGDLSETEYWDDWLAPAVQNTRHLIDSYVQAIYTSRLLEPLDQQQAVRTWRKVQWYLWLARVRRFKLFGRKMFD
ncbi:MAG: transglutaminase domain-containing protein [Anaerolineae bacterium]|nr:transglutaminase domain-containing protein [Anaerolineae bacterium]